MALLQCDWKIKFSGKEYSTDIAYSVHQCARFASNPNFEHGKAIKHKGRYLLGTKDKGILCKPSDMTLGWYADADFAGNWNVDLALKDRNTARSQTGCIIKYASRPITWVSKIQTEIALSSTESEYSALSTALREVMPMINFLKELRQTGFKFHNSTARIICKAFQDNEGALEMARSPKFRPPTKHINTQYHHFHDSIESGDIEMASIDTQN
jgi:hypothetical protein